MREVATAMLMPLEGKLLVAAPSNSHSEFERSVLLVFQVTDKEVRAVALNHPLPAKITDFCAAVGVIRPAPARPNDPIYLGGAHMQDVGLVVHEPGLQWRSTVSPSEALSITSSLDVIQAIAQGDGPRNYLVVVGHSTWDIEVLRDEIVSGAWFVTDAAADVAFHSPPSMRYAHALSACGRQVADRVPYHGRA